MNLVIRYDVPESLRNLEFVQTGQYIRRQVSVECSMADLTPEVRQELVQIDRRLLDNSNSNAGKWKYCLAIDRLEILPTDRLLMPEDIPELIMRYAQLLREQATERAKKEAEQAKKEEEELSRLEQLSDAQLVKEYEKSFLRSSALRNSLIERREQLRQRFCQARETLAKQAEEAEQQAFLCWVEQYGSERLKRATRAGYPCKKQYALERAAQKYPEFFVDTNDNLRFTEVCCPELEDLQELEKFPEARVVWVTRRHDHDCDNYEEYQREKALVISGFLNSYNLVKYLS